MKTFLAATLAALIAVPALADANSDKRKALFIEIVEKLGCRVDGATPSQAFLDAMKNNGFEKSETRVIARDLVKNKQANTERAGRILVLKTGKCA